MPPRIEPEHSPALARPVVAAAADVLGTPLALVLDAPGCNLPEVHTARIAAGVALAEVGWSALAISRATHLDPGALAGKVRAKTIRRAHEAMPKVYAAAARVAALLPKRPTAAERQAEADAVIAAECRRHGLAPDRLHKANDPLAVAVRRSIIDALADRDWTTLQIATAAGFGWSTVHCWRRHRATSNPRDSKPREQTRARVARARTLEFAATP